MGSLFKSLGGKGPGKLHGTSLLEASDSLVLVSQFEKGNSRHTEREFVSFPGGDIREKRLAPCSGTPTLKRGDP